MKYLYLLSLVTLMGCGAMPGHIPEVQERESVNGIAEIPLRRGTAIIRQVVIDSCQYLYDFNTTLNVPLTLTHFGNCKNPIHK